MERRVLDFILVPIGLLVMVIYHIWLFYRILKHPTKTVIGVNAINRRYWVQSMMEDSSKNGVLSVQTLRNNIMASTLLASTAIMLSSLIAVLMANGNKYPNNSNSSSSTFFNFGGGDRSQPAFAVKYFCILSCFLVAFLLNVQSIRYYSHASILINVPFKKIFSNINMASQDHTKLTVDYVTRNVNRGSYFWSLGLRAFYFSFPLFLWIFGSVPMCVSCFVLVFLLYFLDVTFECNWVVAISDEPMIQTDNKDVESGRRN